MDVVPVAKQSEKQQQERDQQQARGLRRVNRVAMVLMRVIVFGSLSRHADIVALGRTNSTLV